MAIYHLTAKIGSRTNGQCARAKAQYVLRLGPYAHEPDALAFARSGNLPAFAAGDPVAYFDAADLYERANGRLFKEVEVALPVELAPDEQRDLLDAFVPVLLAGEPLPTRLVNDIYEQKTIERVFDLYGPSESTTYSTFALRRAMAPATIGRPISNTQVYLLDSQMHPASVGVIGQLYIGGDGLARCYLKRPELTGEKWVPNPFSASPGEPSRRGLISSR